MDAPLETRNLELEASGPVFSRALFSAMGRVPIWMTVLGGEIVHGGPR